MTRGLWRCACEGPDRMGISSWRTLIVEDDIEEGAVQAQCAALTFSIPDD
jgi:hypothetical protein